MNNIYKLTLRQLVKVVVISVMVIGLSTFHVQSKAQTKTEIEKRRKQAEEQVERKLVPEAIVAIEQTKKAIEALSKEQTAEALAAIERATGKLDILLARHPNNALLPGDFQVNIIDMAPTELEVIREIVKSVEKSVREKDYPDSRLLLDMLRSEIHIRTFYLPLAMYPISLKDAARLLEQKKMKESKLVLETALNTLVVTDQVLPLPLIDMEVKLKLAEEKREKNKEEALKLMASARYELERARELGYAGKSEEYVALDKAIREVEKQVKDSKTTASTFSALKEKLRNFLKSHSEAKKSSHEAVKRQK